MINVGVTNQTVNINKTKMKNKIIFIRGLIASGKTTWAKEWVNEDPLNRVRVNKDDIRLEFPKISEKQVISHETDLVNNYMFDKKDIVIDNTHFNPIHEARYKTLANMYNYDFEVKEFEIDPTIAIERDSKRENPVGKKAITRMYFENIYQIPKGLKMHGNTILCDIDGTLAFKGDRSYFDYTKVSGDYFNGILGTILCILNQAGYKIVFLSGREESCRKDTEEWLNLHFKGGFMYYTLLMRKVGDSRDDRIIKREIFDENFTKEEIICVFDDRPRVRTMWLKLGLYVFGCDQEPYQLDF